MVWIWGQALAVLSGLSVMSSTNWPARGCAGQGCGQETVQPGGWTRICVVLSSL